MTILTERERVTTEILLDKGYSFIEVADMLLQARNLRIRNDMAAEVAATVGRKLYPLEAGKRDGDKQEEIDRLKEEVIALSDEKEVISAQNRAELSESEAIKTLAMKQGGYETERIASHLLTLRFLPLWNRIHKEVCSVIEEVFNIPVIEEEKNGKSNS